MGNAAFGPTPAAGPLRGAFFNGKGEGAFGPDLKRRTQLLSRVGRRLDMWAEKGEALVFPETKLGAITAAYAATGTSLARRSIHKAYDAVHSEATLFGAQGGSWGL